MIRVAFLGTGGIAAKHSRFFKDCPDAVIVGGCDVATEKVESLWNRTWSDGAATPDSFTDAEEMYARTSPDAAVICTPHTLHFDHCMQALAHGCHVLVEKPMVTDSKDAYRLRDKINDSGKTFVIGYNTSCSAEFAYLRRTIRDGSLGRLIQVCGYLTQGWKSDTLGSWRQDLALSGGGQAYDSGAHILNSLCWGVDAPVAKVHAFVDNCGIDVDVNTNINVLFENNVMASIVVSGDCSAAGAHMSFIFTDGRIDIDGWGATWMNVFDRKGQVKYPAVTADMDAGQPAQNFVDAILGRAEPRATVENGVVLSELMDQIYESGRTGTVAVPKR